MSGEWSRTVVMLTSVAGQYNAGPGDELALPLSVARAWVEAGLAQWREEPELATVTAPERAVRPRGRARGAAA